MFCIKNDKTRALDKMPSIEEIIVQKNGSRWRFKKKRANSKVLKEMINEKYVHSSIYYSQHLFLTFPEDARMSELSRNHKKSSMMYDSLGM